MRLLRLAKKTGRSKILGADGELDISWASGPGFRGGPENYFCVKAEADEHDYALEFNVDECRCIKEQVDKFLQFFDHGKHRWEPGNYFKKLRLKKK
jgi:hypothetical protein